MAEELKPEEVQQRYVEAMGLSLARSTLASGTSVRGCTGSGMTSSFSTARARNAWRCST